MAFYKGRVNLIQTKMVTTFQATSFLKLFETVKHMDEYQAEILNTFQRIKSVSLCRKLFKNILLIITFEVVHRLQTMRTITGIFLFLAFNSFSQLNCTLQLFDTYSKQVIRIDSSFTVHNGTFQIDTTNNSIRINKLSGKKLKLTADLYCQFEQKFKRKELKNVSRKIYMKPTDVLIAIKYKEIWNVENIPNDTLFFTSIQALQNHLLTYIKYLEYDLVNCDNGTCRYTNTYQYRIYFRQHEALYTLDKVYKTQPKGHECQQLDADVNMLTTIFPPFRLENKHGDFYFNCILSR